MRSGTVTTIGAAALALALCPAAAFAAIPPLDEGPSIEERSATNPIVQRAQKALSKLGLYVGPEDGYLGDATKAAIIIYQRANGLRPDGVVTPDLVAKLEYAVGVRKLMRQLEEAREESMRDARSKLMSHPATRDLMQDGAGDERADPTRDATPCFDKPTAKCLLGEAVESAKAIARTELRDWAYGEILIAEARAGLGERAMRTASRISDPRLIMVALRDIAEAQAAAGRPEEAVSAAEIIPDADKKSAALAAIAEIQLRRGDEKDARVTAETLLAGLDAVAEPLKHVEYRARAAVIFARAGAREKAETELSIAEDAARALPRDSSRSAAMRHVASALADMHEIVRALEMLESVSTPSDRNPVLITAAEAQAKAGDAAAALATASNIDNVRYRAVALGRIALAQAAAGRTEDADTTIETAFAAIDRIDRPFARSYAISRIALAMAEIHRADGGSADARKAALARAVEAALRIDDRRLKAHTLWAIAARQRQAGDDDWRKTEDMAQQATDEVIGALSQVWMFADLAEAHVLEGDEDAAWRAFDRGVVIARTVDNAWIRSRVLAKLAATLIRLVDPGRGAVAVEP